MISQRPSLCTRHISDDARLRASAPRNQLLCWVQYIGRAEGSLLNIKSASLGCRLCCSVKQGDEKKSSIIRRYHNRFRSRPGAICSGPLAPFHRSHRGGDKFKANIITRAREYLKGDKPRHLRLFFVRGKTTSGTLQKGIEVRQPLLTSGYAIGSKIDKLSSSRTEARAPTSLHETPGTVAKPSLFAEGWTCGAFFMRSCTWPVEGSILLVMLPTWCTTIGFNK